MNRTLLHEDLIHSIENTDFDTFLVNFERVYPSDISWLSKILNRKTQYDRKGEFAYKFIKLIIIKDKIQIDKEFYKLNLDNDYNFEIIELIRFLLRIENHNKLEIIEDQLAIGIK